MAPEVQMTGTLGYDPKPVDIWACRIVLVEMLTKNVPWRSTFGCDYYSWRTNRLQEPFHLVDWDVLPLIYMMLDEDPCQVATIHVIKE